MMDSPGIMLKHLAFMATLRDFQEWWLTGFGFLLPEAAQRRLWQTPDILYIDADLDLLSARYLDAQLRQERELRIDEIRSRSEALRGRDCNVIVRLPTSRVLIKPMLLPLAAERNAREVLAFDMDRQTPFTEDRIFFDYRVIGRDVENDRLRVELILTRRDHLEPLLDQINSMGIIPHRVTVQNEGAEWNLLPAARRPAAMRLFSGRTRSLAGAALALVLAVLYVPPLTQTWRLSNLEEKVFALRAQATQARALREEYQALLARPRFLAAALDARVPVIDILNELTLRLPNNTWISQLALRGDRIELQGESDAAGAIIELLDQSGYFTDVQFSSATTKSTATNKDRFHVSARVAPRPPE